MRNKVRLLAGISIFWLALSMLFDGINTLVLPLQLSAMTNIQSQATALGLLTFIGLFAAAMIQPIAGAFSDRFRPVYGRKRMIGIGLLFSLLSLAFFASASSMLGVMLGYLAIQVSASVAQAGQQALIPDLVDARHRGLASGLKGFMDIGGAMLGFVVLGQLLGKGQPVLAIGVIAAILVIAYLTAVSLTPEDRPNQQRVVKSVIRLRQIFHLDRVQDHIFMRLLATRFLFLLGIYATGRFLLFFVADRLGLEASQAAAQAGTLLAGLALITVLASPVTGWLADRVGRLAVMLAGSILGAVSALLLIGAGSSSQILLFGGLMSLGSAAFAGGSWALIADVVPNDESARYYGLANFSTAGAAAAAGLFGPLIDWSEVILPGSRYSILFLGAACAFLASGLPLIHQFRNEVQNVRERNRNKREDRADASGLAILSLPADSTSPQEDPYPPGGSARL